MGNIYSILLEVEVVGYEQLEPRSLVWWRTWDLWSNFPASEVQLKQYLYPNTHHRFWVAIIIQRDYLWSVWRAYWLIRFHHISHKLLEAWGIIAHWTISWILILWNSLTKFMVPLRTSVSTRWQTILYHRWMGSQVSHRLPYLLWRIWFEPHTLAIIEEDDWCCNGLERYDDSQATQIEVAPYNSTHHPVPISCRSNLWSHSVDRMERHTLYLSRDLWGRIF